MARLLTCEAPACTDTFVRRSPGQRYCSTACRARGIPRRRAHPPTYGLSHVCVECAAPFRTTGSRQFYCSAYCKQLTTRRKRQAERDAGYPTRTCGWCTGSLAHLSQQARYCSVKCKEAGRYARDRSRRIAASRDYAQRPQVAAVQTARRHNRRALRRQAVTVPFTADQLVQRLSMFRGCWICGHAASTVDHVKPLSKNGPHMLANLRPACLSCNSRKHATWTGVADAMRQVERLRRTRDRVVVREGCGGKAPGRWMAGTARAG